GYYVSLLAAARGHRPFPGLATVLDMKNRSLVRSHDDALEGAIQRSLRNLKAEDFTLSVYFGRNVARQHERLAHLLFEMLPAPFLRARFVKTDRWRLVRVGPIQARDIPDTHRDFVLEAARQYLAAPPARVRRSKRPRYHLAILHDPQEAQPPSAPETLARFRRVAARFGMASELIERSDKGRIGEFDALFIRETTYVNHWTYRFARRAEAEEMVVIDDPRSIMRCTNKVFLAETMARHRVATPRTLVLTKENAMAGLQTLGFPCVLKLPDSSFSNGVSRVDKESDAPGMLASCFETTDLLVAQEYVPTDFDWRIGVLGGKALFACRYGMAAEHWQIIKRDADGVHEGDSETMLVEDAPKEVIKLAVRASNLMGDGLYGVDIKIVKGKPVIIEINDNPNIDAGVEDAALGDELYLRIMQHFFWKLESR
ncbi:MAG: RimK family protein, partial [Phycisphaerales bacterium]|nr:RimK family protein [Phycisphaerales bacterium]